MLKLVKLRDIVTKTGKYEVWGNKSNRIELRKILPKVNKNESGLRQDTFQSTKNSVNAKKSSYRVIKEKLYSRHSISRKQYNPETGELVGKSTLWPSYQNNNGSIMINDATITMDKPYICHGDKIGKREMVSPHGLEILDSVNPTPMCSRFIKMLMNTYNSMKK